MRTLNLVARARRLSFTPGEVRNLIGLGAPEEAACDDVRALAAKRLELIRHKIADLQVLEEAIGRCSGGSAPECAIIDLLQDKD